MNRGREKKRTLHLIVPLRYVLKLRNNNASDYVRTLWKKTITIKRFTSDTVILSRGLVKAYSTLWWPPSIKGCTQPLSSDPKIKLEYHSFLPYLMFSPFWGISTSWNLSPLHNWSQVNHKIKGGVRSKYTRQTCSNSRTHVKREKHKDNTTQQCYSSK
jgi:hypothetical protein